MKPASSTLQLTKFDVAERQLFVAIRLFFSEDDAVSIHTLCEASAQVMHDIGKSAGVRSVLRDSDRIRPERKKEWLNAVFKSRNFFKHAEKDKDETHEFKSEFNDVSLLDAVNMHATLKKGWTPETLLFLVWFGLKYPNLMKEDSDLSPVLAKLASARYFTDPDDKALFFKAIAAIRSGTLSLPNVVFHMGHA